MNLMKLGQSKLKIVIVEKNTKESFSFLNLIFFL